MKVIFKKQIFFLETSEFIEVRVRAELRKTEFKKLKLLGKNSVIIEKRVGVRKYSKIAEVDSIFNSARVIYEYIENLSCGQKYLEFDV